MDLKSKIILIAGPTASGKSNFAIKLAKKINGEIPNNWKNACNFDCFYYCYKMNLPRDIVWLE